MKRIVVIGIVGAIVLGAAWSAAYGYFTPPPEPFYCTMPRFDPDLPFLITLRDGEGRVSALSTQFGNDANAGARLELDRNGGLDRVLSPESSTGRRLQMDYFDDGKVRSVGLLKAGKKAGLWVTWIDASTVDVEASGLYMGGERFCAIDARVIPALTRHQ